MNDDLTTLVLATGNVGKIRELEELLSDLPIVIRSLAADPDLQQVEETGTTFRENAEIKATACGRRTGELSLADDSGLEVDALGGAPGIHSARFAGDDTGYDVKITRLLEMLAETGSESRRARFVCAMALAGADGKVLHVVNGSCSGVIAEHPRGTGGFGYDPVFIPDGFDLSFGELSSDVKRRISHRSVAAELIKRYLLAFIAV